MVYPASEGDLATLSSTARALLRTFAESAEKNTAALGSAALAQENFLRVALAAAAPLPTDGTPYSRQMIYAGPEGEAMIAHWPAGSVCYPHDHGEAWGAVLVLEGKVYEKGFRLGGALEEFAGEHAYDRGAAIPVRPGDIHNMRAETRSVTLHLYAPPIRAMKVYDQRNRTIYTVADDCGAWIPREPHRILQRESFDRDSVHDEVPRGR